MTTTITKISQENGERVFHLGDGTTASKAELANRIKRGESVKLLSNSRLTPVTDISLLDSRAIRTVPNGIKSDNIDNNIN